MIFVNRKCAPLKMPVPKFCDVSSIHRLPALPHYHRIQPIKRNAVWGTWVLIGIFPRGRKEEKISIVGARGFIALMGKQGKQGKQGQYYTPWQLRHPRLKTTHQDEATPILQSRYPSRHFGRLFESFSVH